MELPLEVGRLPHFPTMRDGTFGPEMNLCCYTNTGTKYPITLNIEIQTVFKKVRIFIKTSSRHQGNEILCRRIWPSASC